MMNAIKISFLMILASVVFNAPRASALDQTIQISINKTTNPIQVAPHITFSTSTHDTARICVSNQTSKLIDKVVLEYFIDQKSNAAGRPFEEEQEFSAKKIRPGKTACSSVHTVRANAEGDFKYNVHAYFHDGSQNNLDPMTHFHGPSNCSPGCCFYACDVTGTCCGYQNMCG